MNDSQFYDQVEALGFSSEVLQDGGMVQLSSSNLFGVAYNAGSDILTVSFLNGGVYEYSGVPKSEVIQLLSAGSHGSYFHYNIRMSYPFQRV